MSERIHPVFLATAVVVMLTCAAVIAHQFGWIGPQPVAATATAPLSASAPALVAQASTPAPQPAATPLLATPAPSTEPVASPTSKPTARPTPRPTRKPTPRPQITPYPDQEVVIAPTPRITPRPLCMTCGHVVAIQPRTIPGEASPLGAVIGGGVGYAIGNQIGKGKGKNVARAVGTIGGLLLGREIEKQARSTTVYDVSVEFEDGHSEVINYLQPPQFSVGSKVRRESDGSLSPRYD
ncbi:glycine zipper 2TM domain-containing protein [Chitinilyticum piscinae]|uniref:Glycine zipper 2TM domain-containing protein n=1 Tax=Chitinilyticum piscinae TaxID=2866724 RepID=A0A8J7G0F9_9NEIS|nr:glycine zipper 2TM domain-containing protein [Chitinilyticum piscinae]MBE9609068.1 glycine zipper 2TM domain-containing protein [Chitinilyticum piscinae]